MAFESCLDSKDWGWALYPLNKLVIWCELALWKECNSEWGREDLGWSSSLWSRAICREELKCTISSQNSVAGESEPQSCLEVHGTHECPLSKQPFFFGLTKSSFIWAANKEQVFNFLTFQKMLCCGFRIYNWFCNMGLICYKTQTFFFWLEIKNYMFQKISFFWKIKIIELRLEKHLLFAQKVKQK